MSAYVDISLKEQQVPEETLLTEVEAVSKLEYSDGDSIDASLQVAGRIITKEIIEEEEKLITRKDDDVDDDDDDDDEEWTMDNSMEKLDKETAERKFEKLKSLLSKSELYSLHLVDRIKSQQAKEEKKLKPINQSSVNQEETNLQTKQKAEVIANGKPGTRYRLREVGNRKQDNIQKSKVPHKRKAKNTNQGDENSFKRRKVIADVAEDCDVKVDEDGQDKHPEICVQSVNGVRTYKGQLVPEEQPQLLVGGVLRNYQLDGFKWLKSLYENGVNGILADEMGLGKTIQCISLIASVIEKGINGPFFICGPLSTVPNWVSEFKRFTPKIPVIMYHGSKQERHDLRAKFNQFYPVIGDIKVRPVVITSYGVAMNDRPLIMSYDWKIMIVDEGHRIKNSACKLISQLKMYKLSHRLLLTGTPLQNDLSELWSLLNFLLPEIFDDLGSFEAWFDPSSLQSSECHEQIVEEERKKNILNMIHKIVSPFMLRRLKADVDLCIPPKGEIVVFASMTEQQSKMYKAIIEETIQAMVGGKQDEEPKPECLDKNNRPRRRSRQNIDYGVLDCNNEELWVKAVSRLQEARKQWGSNERKEESNFDAEVNIQLRNKLALLRKACNHPYLISYPLTKSGEYRIDEDLVKASGKFLLLDKMLSALKKDGHKLLIFSQMTTTLDILSDFCYLRNWKFCQLDGRVSIEDRCSQIKDFNNDPETFIFLLSTRAGGLGINLMAADTVILFDSDWNPQIDIQAEDRCHRIGQTRPVLVYRLVTKNTVDEKIVRRANAKRKLEKMVIHKGQFKRGLNEDMKPISAISPEELEQILKETDYDAVVENEVISDENLHKLLDRSSLLQKMKENQAQVQSEAGKNDEHKTVDDTDNTTMQEDGVFEVIV